MARIMGADDKIVRSIDNYPQSGAEGIPSGGYVTEVEQLGTNVHRNPVTLELPRPIPNPTGFEPLNTAEINFGHSLSKGVGGLHIAQIFYRVYSWEELAKLKREARKLLGGEVIDLSRAEEEESAKDAYQAVVDLIERIGQSEATRHQKSEALDAVEKFVLGKLQNYIQEEDPGLGERGCLDDKFPIEAGRPVNEDGSTDPGLLYVPSVETDIDDSGLRNTELDEFLAQWVDQIELPPLANMALRRAGYTTVGSVISSSRADIIKILVDFGQIAPEIAEGYAQRIGEYFENNRGIGYDPWT